MQTILLVGNDPILLRTRAAVLRRTGAQTLCASGRAALAVQAEHMCEVVVLCHSLPEQFCAAMAQVIHERWPGTRILLVLAERRDWEFSSTWARADEITSSNPERLLGRTIELLGGPLPMQRESATSCSSAFIH